MAPSTPEEAIRRTLAQYCQLFDDGRSAEWIDLFTTDARFHVMHATAQGHEAIVEAVAMGMTEEARGRHALFQPVIELAPDARSAKVWTDFCFLDRRRQITAVGRYHDELRAGDDGRWRFVLREIVFLGRGPELAEPTPA